MTLLERYLAGERDEVWAELRAADESVREEPLFTEAQSVLREAMTRVRRNVQTIVAFLEGEGYRFGTYWRGDVPLEEVEAFQDFPEPPLGMPEPDVLERIETFEREFGEIPLSLRTFWEVVGSVQLIGHHPDWVAFSNPMWIEPITTLEMTEREKDDYEGEIRIYFAPDIHHKEDVSGGEDYFLTASNKSIDGSFWYERYEQTFLKHLQHCFEYAGFPGYALEMHLTRPALPLPERLQRLAASLEPI
jgi:hypothetical protein